ncbi:MEE40 [Symbiodinium natans]|uniref:MEE40 protein n=1 Tax=Symbiodinium natans TaxID=878477 RepID=A0A812P3R3_9DINO|nr:MEE40 [Symbiodinium natans]
MALAGGSGSSDGLQRLPAGATALSALPQLIKSRQLHDILDQPAQRRGRQLAELMSVISREPGRLRLQRSAYTKLLRALGTGKRKMWREAIFLLWKCRDFLVNEDAVMYNTVLQTCAEGAQWQRSLLILNEMLVYGPFPDVVSFNSALGALARASIWTRALHLLGALPVVGLTPSARTMSTAAKACTGANEVSKACELVHDMTRQSVPANNVVRTVLVQALSVQSDWQQCLEQVRLLRSGAEGFIPAEEPDARLLTTAAVACGRCHEWQQALGLLAEADWHAMRDIGFRSAVERACIEAGQHGIAEAVRRSRPEAAKAWRGAPEIITRRARLAKAAANVAEAAHTGNWPEAVRAVEDVWQNGRAPNGALLREAIEVCGEQAWEWALELLERARERGPPVTPALVDTVIGCLRHAWRSALDVLEDMARRQLQRTLFSYTRCLSACAEGVARLEAAGATDARPWRFGVALLAEAQDAGIQEDVMMDNTLMRCFSKRWQQGVHLLHGMEMLRLEPSVATRAAAARLLGQGAPEQVPALLRQLAMEAPETELAAVYNAALSGLQAARRWQQALCIVEMYLAEAAAGKWRPDPTCATNAMTACAVASAWPAALALFSDLERMQIEKDVVVVSCALRALQNGQKWEEAVELLRSVSGQGLELTLKTRHALLACCAEAGRWEMSLATLEELGSLGDDAIPESFNIVLGALQRTGSKWPRCLHLFEEIPARTSRPPNFISYRVMLEDCSAVRLWEGLEQPNLEVMDTTVMDCGGNWGRPTTPAQVHGTPGNLSLTGSELLLFRHIVVEFSPQAKSPAQAALLRASLEAAVQQGAPPRCLEATGPNFFLLFPLADAQFGQPNYAALESVLFHHPAASVLIIGLEQGAPLFQAYQREGYCVATLQTDLPALGKELVAAVGGEHASSVDTFLASHGQPKTEAALIRLFNAVLLALQVVDGGTSLPMDGILLNPWDFALPLNLSLPSTGVFLEKLEATDTALPWALQAEDFERSWLPRSYFDRSDGGTSVCLDALCPRTLPRGSSFARRLLVMLLTGRLEQEGLDISQYATMLYRTYVGQRPSQAPFQVGDVDFDHEMVLLPYWLHVQPHFADGWKDYGGTDSDLTQYSDLYQPRHMRAMADWSLISTARLWLPLSYGPASARQALPGSVVDLALRHFTLDLAPRPFKKKTFQNGRKRQKPRVKRLRSPADATAENTAFIDEVYTARGQPVYREGALPGPVGGFRTFREVRLVGFENQGLSWRVTVHASTNLRFFCRAEHRRQGLGGPSSSQSRSCQAGLRQAASQGGEESVVFETCGSPAEVNAAVSLLAYHPMPSTTSVVVAEPRRDARLTAEELEAHFGLLRISASTAGAGCSSETGPVASQVQLSALLDDVQEHITVVAHCAERCHLLDRLALSFREFYDHLPIIATCECAEDEGCTAPVPRAHPSVAHMTVLSVPYDFGLSRGKTLLIEMTQTEFVLVLDDDFTHSIHSCLECMLWKMRSRHYSLWKPFDILGFPVQEDERGFGAFRGRLRVTNQQLFLEPMVEELLPDGCIRVEICPMVFLGRTARMKTFQFQKDLRVGEHEQFFYSNAYQGVQVAVCFDSSFPHFRVNTMSAGYVKRRERMPQLMANAFEKLGFERARAMFLFRKYDHGRMEDYDELLDKTVPPWHVGHDTCGPPTAPPVPFAQLLAVVLTTADAVGQAFRSVLRSRSWLQRFGELAGAASLRWVFAVHPQADEAGLHNALQQEQDAHQDILVLPAATRLSPAATGQEATTDQLLQAFGLLRDFHFRWLLVTRHDVFVRPEGFLDELQRLEPAGRKVLGSWQPQQRSWRLDPHFFILPRDVFALISAPEVISRLAAHGPHSVFGDLSGLAAGVSAWMHAFDVERRQLQGAHARKDPALVCQVDTVTLHPVSPEELQALSHSPSSFQC